ncbi:putative serine dehydratase domain-containing protein [Xylariomycetidae sp. FL2044]|nr:putative serine dehydratase domain-containing protein [Xylariomycetidae sp. FL2044]
MILPPSLFPCPPKDRLSELYVGKDIRDVPTPAAILDVAVVKRNCERMLDACDSLNLQWRAHLKTHKTAEVAKLQVGDDVNRPVNLIISTLEEAEFVLPMLRQYRAQGRAVNILHGLPISPGHIPRFYALGRALGPDSISFLVDHPDQLKHVRAAAATGAQTAQPADVPQLLPHAYIKVNMGGDRAGVVPGSASMAAVIAAALEAHDAGALVLTGLYSHAGHSYGGDSRVAALRMLGAEMRALLQAADEVVNARARAEAAEGGGDQTEKEKSGGRRKRRPLPPLVLSVGASPTALAVQNILSARKTKSGDTDGKEEEEEEAAADSDSDSDSDSDLVAAAQDVSALFDEVRAAGHVPEIHAGVYPLLDLQQLAAHSLSKSRLSWDDMAFTVLAEVHSVYPGRGGGGGGGTTPATATSEALVGAGVLALGRETCKAYPGMAMMTPWGRRRRRSGSGGGGAGGGGEPFRGDVEEAEGWIIGRFAQEHGIVTWLSRRGNNGGSGGDGDGDGGDKEATPPPPPPPDELEVGQKVRLWPNHACITSSHFGWYVVVDSSREGKEDEVVDIFVRARGW